LVSSAAKCDQINTNFHSCLQRRILYSMIRLGCLLVIICNKVEEVIRSVESVGVCIMCGRITRLKCSASVFMVQGRTKRLNLSTHPSGVAQICSSCSDMCPRCKLTPFDREIPSPLSPFLPALPSFPFSVMGQPFPAFLLSQSLSLIPSTPSRFHTSISRTVPFSVLPLCPFSAFFSPDNRIIVLRLSSF